MRGDIETFSKDGAERLAGIIVSYWSKRGHDCVRASVYQFGAGDWGVRSNLVAGMPLTAYKLKGLV